MPCLLEFTSPSIKMLTETFVTSIKAQQKSANTAIAKDVGIYVHDLYPTLKAKATFKKSSTQARCLAVNTTHIFAAQADKAVVHVYSRERGNQEALISFPERIHCIELIHDGLIALGTAEGRIILWEIFTGRQFSTPTSHLQAVSCLSSTSQHLISGSEDSNIHVWQISNIMSTKPEYTNEPLRSLSNHRAAITSLAAGHSSARTNFCISTSKDNTAVVWNYHTGTLLRTFLLPATPLCISLDPADRVVYLGFEDGSIQPINLFDPTSSTNSLYDPSLQSTPVQIASTPFTGSPSEIEALNCMAMSYDGSVLLSGHESGKVIQWEVGLQKFAVELSEMNAPVNNIIFLSPFSPTKFVKALAVVKPKLGESNDNFTGQFTNQLRTDTFESICGNPGFPIELLAEIASNPTVPAPSSTAASSDAALRKENEDLWKIINEQRALQKRTYDKFRETAS